MAGIVAFWFNDAARPTWFVRDAAFDATLRARFEEDVVRAARGRLPTDAEAATLLARVLLFDQLPRNIWRGTARAFAYDALARATSREALRRGLDTGQGKDERLFFYLPFEHSEDLGDQDRSVALFAALGDAELVDYAERHRAIIRRFGRFPHRNAILSRVSTPEEIAFLREPGSSF